MKPFSSLFNRTHIYKNDKRISSAFVWYIDPILTFEQTSVMRPNPCLLQQNANNVTNNIAPLDAQYRDMK